MRTYEEHEITVGSGQPDARGATGTRRLRFEVLENGLRRSDAVFAVRYSHDGRIYRRALVGRLYNPRVRSVDFPPFRRVAAELVGWAARPDLGAAFARGITCDADPINNEPDYVSDSQARDSALELEAARARAELTEWAEERRLTGEGPLAREGWNRALDAFDRADGELRAAHQQGLAGALAALGIAGEATSTASESAERTDDGGAKRYRVVLHTSYEEIFEVVYDGDPEDLRDELTTQGEWTRISSKSVDELGDCGTSVESVEEIRS